MNWKELIKTKTFWVGIIAIAGGIVEGVFDGWDRAYDKLLLGAAMITGRHAIGKSEAKVVESKALDKDNGN